MSFYAEASSIKNKIETVLADEGLVLTIKEKYPITLIIAQSQSPYAQMEFLSEGEGNVSSKDSALRFVFDIDGLEIRTSERLIITDALLSKLKGLAKKYHTAYTHAFFAEKSQQQSDTADTKAAASVPENAPDDMPEDDFDPDEAPVDTDDIEIDVSDLGDEAEEMDPTGEDDGDEFAEFFDDDHDVSGLVDEG